VGSGDELGDELLVAADRTGQVPGVDQQFQAAEGVGACSAGTGPNGPPGSRVTARSGSLSIACMSLRHRLNAMARSAPGSTWGASAMEEIPTPSAAAGGLPLTMARMPRCPLMTWATTSRAVQPWQGLAASQRFAGAAWMRARNPSESRR
jgi:hypothetical protein